MAANGILSDNESLLVLHNSDIVRVGNVVDVAEVEWVIGGGGAAQESFHRNDVIVNNSHPIDATAGVVGQADMVVTTDVIRSRILALVSIVFHTSTDLRHGSEGSTQLFAVSEPFPLGELGCRTEVGSVSASFEKGSSLFLASLHYDRKHRLETRKKETRSIIDRFVKI